MTPNESFQDRTRRRGVLLASGLPDNKPTSFVRQLRLLARGLTRLGRRVVVIGTGTNAPLTSERLSEHRDLADRAILLGYSDQFPVLWEDAGRRCILWAQLSSAPAGPVPNAPVVALTETTAAFARDSGWTVAEIIPHCVDATLFYPHLRESRTAVRFLTVGANNTRKRFDRLLDAFDRARAVLAGRGVEARLTIKTDALQKPGGFDLRDGRSQVNMDDRELADREMAALYRAHDVYVHAAEWEGFGIPVIEAMACGLPVVCPEGQGPAELLPYRALLADTEPGPADAPQSVRWVCPDSLAERMIEAAVCAGLSRKLGAAGRTAVLDSYDLQVVAARWHARLG